MDIEIIAFGIAKDILGSKRVNLSLDEAGTVGMARQKLMEQYPLFKTLASLQLAVNAEYVTDDHVLQENDEVVLIPPVSGG